MSTQRNYTKVSGGSDNKRWEPNKLTGALDPNNLPTLEGYYVGCKEIKGANGVFNVHTIHEINADGTLGDMFDVSLGAVVDDILGTKIHVGSFVCIVYKGKKASKTPGRSYNDIDIFQDANAIPYTKLANGSVIVNERASVPRATTPNAGAPAGSKPKSNNPNFEEGSLPF